MSIVRLKEQFRRGEIEKPDYIVKMHEYHSVLFEYSKFLRNTDIEKIEISDDGVVMTSRKNGIKMICDMKDQRIAPIEILNFDSYEAEEIRLLVEIIPDGAVVLDVGGNIGWYSIALSKIKKDICVYVFEPIAKTYDYLMANIKINGLNNVKAFNFGLSDQDGVSSFFYYSEGSGNASMKKMTDDQTVFELQSTVMRMDSFAANEKLTQLDFIKCDVEGAELLVFKGGRETIVNHKPVVFSEMLRKWSAKFDYHPNDIIAFFREIDYLCFAFGHEGLRQIEAVSDETVETNFLFMNQAKHREKIEQLKKSTKE